jgi:hypothetical protein
VRGPRAVAIASAITGVPVRASGARSTGERLRSLRVRKIEATFDGVMFASAPAAA